MPSCWCRLSPPAPQKRARARQLRSCKRYAAAARQVKRAPPPLRLPREPIPSRLPKPRVKLRWRIPPQGGHDGIRRVYLPSHPPERSLYDGHRRDLDRRRWADELSFSEAWIGDHHTAPWEPNPTPDLLIAQALMETKNIRLAPGDLSLSLGYVAVPREPYPAEMREARERVFAACRNNRIAFLETVAPETVVAKLDEGCGSLLGTAREPRALDAPISAARCPSELPPGAAAPLFAVPTLSGRRRTAETCLSGPVSSILLDLGRAFVQGKTILVPADFR